MEEVLEKIDEVWGEYDDYDENNIEYLLFIINKDIEEIEKEEYGDKVIERELSDVVINVLRYFEANDINSTEIIMDRLEKHKEKELDDLVEEKQSIFNDRK